MQIKHIVAFATVLSSVMLGACQTRVDPTKPLAAVDGMRAEIGVIETTDLHSNVDSYDFFKLAQDRNLGLERAASLIKIARKQFRNSLLIDDGDTIQGTVLADYQALVKPLPCDQELAVYKAMDTLGYDAGTIGNHEFNYGLPFLSQVTGTPFNVTGLSPRTCSGPHYPLVLSNVFSSKDGKPLFAPFRVLKRNVHATRADGSEVDVSLRIGLLGFAPPPIMDWDKRNLEGKVSAMGVVEAAQKYLPELQRTGVDLVIALSHGGLNTSPYTSTMENAGWHLAGVAGIDAILLGHSHDIFPNPNDPKSHYAHMRDVDNVRGSVRGVPAVMGNYYGKSIGLIDLALVHADGRWQVDRGKTHSEVRSVKNADGSYVESDPAIAQSIAAEQAATVAYVKTPIGATDFAMTTYFAAAGDTSGLQLVNAAQREYVQKYIRANLPDLAQLPVLSAAAPFKAGFGGANDYTDVAAGPLAINNAADLYLYPNTVSAVRVDATGLKCWLEKSAEWFNRIDPARRDSQELLNRRFSTFNFDVIQGNFTYSIDVTKPGGDRIGDMRLNGKPVTPDQNFVVVTNNYRASGGGNFPGVDGSNIVASLPDANRDVVINFVRAAGTMTRAQFADARNWRFAPVKTTGPVVFTSATGKLALAREAGLSNISLVRDNSDGTSIYSIDLSR